VGKFGRLDVLVNNAANFYAGFFEELLPEQMERQLSTSLIGPMNVTRAVLPVMRKQRSGLIITISSSAGLIGFEFGTAYAASKFGIEGWMQSLQVEVNRLVSVPPGGRGPTEQVDGGEWRGAHFSRARPCLVAESEAVKCVRPHFGVPISVSPFR